MEINISNSEWYVLECLWESSPKTLMQIVEECREKVGWAKSTCTTMVKRMDTKGLIRHEDGGRAKPFLSDGGQGGSGRQTDKRFSETNL